MVSDPFHPQKAVSHTSTIKKGNDNYIIKKTKRMISIKKENINFHSTMKHKRLRAKSRH
jgi:hypothetical protein